MADSTSGTIDNPFLTKMREPLSRAYLWRYVRSSDLVDLGVEGWEAAEWVRHDTEDTTLRVDPFASAWDPNAVADYWEITPEAYQRTMEAADRKAVESHASLQDDARRCAALLEELRRNPPHGAFVLSSEAETAWMTPEEKDLVEWFDRGEYAIFLRLSELLDPHAGWLVPYLRYCCVRFSLGCDPVADSKWQVEPSCEIGHVIDRMAAAADQGNGRALNCLAVLHERGYRNARAATHLHGAQAADIPKDPVKGRDFYRRSAEAGCTIGAFNYARVLKNGIGGGRDLGEACRHYRVVVEGGMAWFGYLLAGLNVQNGSDDPEDFARLVRMSAEAGERDAQTVVRAAGADASPRRLLAEYFIHEGRKKSRDAFEHISFSVIVPTETDNEKRKWLSKQLPAGTVVPPEGGRDQVRLPNLQSANPSFAARLIILVRDRFNGNAPAVYNAAHLSRKTYSSIVSNELRPVSKQTALALALALRLTREEAVAFVGSAGFALSTFILQDIVVDACLRAGIYDIDSVNEILMAHRAKTLSADGPGGPEAQDEGTHAPVHS